MYTITQYIFLLGIITATLYTVPPDKKTETVTIAIIVKDMAHTLPLYLSCIENQTWPQKKTNLYIRTNNNKDNTVAILESWLRRVQNRYAKVYFDHSDLPLSSSLRKTVEPSHLHRWNKERFNVLGDLRQASVNWAMEHNSHYFVADADNFIKPDTIEKLIATNLPVVAPLLKKNNNKLSDSTFYTTEPDVAFCFRTNTPLHKALLSQEIQALTEVPIVHCTYFIRHEFLKKVSYNDGSNRWEFLIFSDALHKQHVPQYIDTRELYGFFTSATNEVDFNWWLKQFLYEPWIQNVLQNSQDQLQQSKPYLWVYWENRTNNNTPGYIALCRKTLLKHCSKSFTIVELNEQTIYNYLPELLDKTKQLNLDRLCIAQRVDYYRVLLLQKYGGLYLDSDIIVMKNLKEITDKLYEYDFVGFGDYHRKKRCRIGQPENWAMASRPHGIFISYVVQEIENELSRNLTPSYHGLGNKLLKQVLKPLLTKNNYQYYHYENTYDGTRENSGKLVTMEKMFSTDKTISFKNFKDLLFIPLYGSGLSHDIKQQTEEELLQAPSNFTRFIQLSLSSTSME